MTNPSPVSETKMETRARYRTDWVDGTVEHRVLDYLNQHLPAEYVPFHIEKFERDGKTVIWSRREAALRSASIAQEGWRPIETAPKGSRMLLWVCTRNSIRRGMAVVGYWDDGWWSSMEPIDTDAVKLWQPLPAAPTPPTEEEKS